MIASAPAAIATAPSIGATALWLFTTRNTELKDTEVAAAIGERLQTLDATQTQRFSTQVRLYKEPQLKGAVSKSMYVVATSRAPNRTFSIINDACVEGTTDLEAIVAKLKNLYTLRQTITITGYEYTLGDFCVRLGSINLLSGTAKRAVALEIEYRPLSSLIVAFPMITELMQALLPESLHSAAQRESPMRFLNTYHLEPRYSHSHTVCQYVLALQTEEIL